VKEEGIRKTSPGGVSLPGLRFVNGKLRVENGKLREINIYKHINLRHMKKKFRLPN